MIRQRRQRRDGMTGERKDRRTEGPKDRRTEGPKDRRTKGPKDQRTKGPKDRRTEGPKDQRTKGPKDRRTEEHAARCATETKLLQWTLPFSRTSPPHMRSSETQIATSSLVGVKPRRLDLWQEQQLAMKRRGYDNNEMGQHAAQCARSTNMEAVPIAAASPPLILAPQPPHTTLYSPLPTPSSFTLDTAVLSATCAGEDAPL